MSSPLSYFALASFLLILLAPFVPSGSAQAPTFSHVERFDKAAYQLGERGVANITVNSDDFAEIEVIQFFLYFRTVDGLTYTTHTGEVYDPDPLIISAKAKISKFFEFTILGSGYLLVSGPVMYQVFISIRKTGNQSFYREISTLARAFDLSSPSYPSYDSILSENISLKNQVASSNAALNSAESAAQVLGLTTIILLTITIYQTLTRKRRSVLQPKG